MKSSAMTTRDTSPNGMLKEEFKGKKLRKRCSNNRVIIRHFYKEIIYSLNIGLLRNN